MKDIIRIIDHPCVPGRIYSNAHGSAPHFRPTVSTVPFVDPVSSTCGTGSNNPNTPVRSDPDIFCSTVFQFPTIAECSIVLKDISVAIHDPGYPVRIHSNTDSGTRH